MLPFPSADRTNVWYIVNAEISVLLCPGRSSEELFSRFHPKNLPLDSEQMR